MGEDMTELMERAPGDGTEEGDGRFVLRINGREYDALDLTLNEVEEVEDLNGGAALLELDITRPKVLKAFVYVLLKRDDPTVTLAQAGEMKMRAVLGGDDA